MDYYLQKQVKMYGRIPQKYLLIQSTGIQQSNFLPRSDLTKTLVKTVFQLANSIVTIVLIGSMSTHLPFKCTKNAYVIDWCVNILHLALSVILTRGHFSFTSFMSWRETIFCRLSDFHGLFHYHQREKIDCKTAEWLRKRSIKRIRR